MAKHKGKESFKEAIDPTDRVEAPFTDLGLMLDKQKAQLQLLLAQLKQQPKLRWAITHDRQGAASLQKAARLITRSLCTSYQIPRASICHFADCTLTPQVSYRLEHNQYTAPTAIDSRHSPALSLALHQQDILAIEDTMTAPCLHELHDDYLCPLAIGALLYIGIRVDDELLAVLCLEHTGSRRVWQVDEISFASKLAEQYGQILDITAKHKSLSALHLLLRAMEQSPEALILLDNSGAVAYANPSFSRLSQSPENELLGQPIATLPVLGSLQELIYAADSELSHNDSWHGECRALRNNQSPYWCSLSVSKLYSDTGLLTHYLAVYKDITESKQSLQQLRRLAFKDSLTGLNNRDAFILELEKRFCTEKEASLCLLLVDIDNFKRINHSLGHQTGDKLLASLAKRLRNTAAPETVLARFASNEFAILLDDCELERGLVFAKQVLSILEKPLFAGNQLISISGSIGLAVAPMHGRDHQTLIRHAGQALHKAKTAGRQQLYVFNDSLSAEAGYKLLVENSLHHALMQNELEVFYQPKVCLKNGQLIGLEALLRWRRSTADIITPDEFIGLAEETGLIIPIGKWVVQQACRVSKDLSAAGLVHVPVAINLSPKQFIDQKLVESIIAILAEEQLPAEVFELELTEGLLLEATDETRNQLLRLKQSGFTLAMDDFGTGYSSLSYLKKFPIDVIKIDRSFIKDIPHNQNDMEITSAVIAMAHKLKIKVVAEGIETPAQLDFLRSQHCDIGQGYLFSKAIAECELLEELQRFPYLG